MATAPLIQYLRLDQANDPIFDPTAALTNLQACQQAIYTRLELFLGEWWEDLGLGLPVFQSMLGQLGSQQGLAAMQLAVQQNVSGAPYVTAVTSVDATFNNVTGALSITVTAQTVFGVVTVTVVPGLSASLEY